MGAAFAAGAAAGVVGAYFDRQSANRDRRADAAADARTEEERQHGRAESYEYGQEALGRTRANYAGYQESGTRSNEALQFAMGLGPNEAGRGAEGGGGYGRLTETFRDFDFEAAPGYQFRLGEGLKGVERAAGRTGSPFSGATLKALQRYSQNFASNEYGAAFSRYGEDYDRFTSEQDRYFNALAGMSGAGQSAAADVAAAERGTAADVSASGGTGEQYAEEEAATEEAREAARRAEAERRARGAYDDPYATGGQA